MFIFLLGLTHNRVHKNNKTDNNINNLSSNHSQLIQSMLLHTNR